MDKYPAKALFNLKQQSLAACNKFKSMPPPAEEEVPGVIKQLVDKETLKAQRSKTTGLWLDSQASEYVPSNAEIDIRKFWKQLPNKANSGLEPIEEETQVTTLENKLKNKTYKELLALAGCAVKQQETALDGLDERLSRLRKLANTFVRECGELEREIEFLKRLYVVE